MRNRNNLFRASGAVIHDKLAVNCVGMTDGNRILLPKKTHFPHVAEGVGTGFEVAVVKRHDVPFILTRQLAQQPYVLLGISAGTARLKSGYVKTRSKCMAD